MARADKAPQDIKVLHPGSPAGFTLDKLDCELLSITLIHALPTEYNNFASSLLLLDLLDLNKCQSAFQNEESQCIAHNVSVSSPSNLASLALSSSSTPPICNFCGGIGYTDAHCFEKQRASADAKQKCKQKEETGQTQQAQVECKRSTG